MSLRRRGNFRADLCRGSAEVYGLTPVQQIESVAVLENKLRWKGVGGCLTKTGEGPKDKSHDRMSVDVRRELNV